MQGPQAQDNCACVVLVTSWYLEYSSPPPKRGDWVVTKGMEQS